MKKNRSCLSWLLLTLSILASILILAYVPVLAEGSFGAPSPYLSAWQRFSYSFTLVSQAGDLTTPIDPFGAEGLFVIESGESVSSITDRLEEAGLVRDAHTLRVYLLYTGLDTSVQAGTYRLSPAMTALEIASALQDATPAEVTFYILPGWRLEEVAAALPTSGLAIEPASFLAAAAGAEAVFLPLGAGAEGFCFPQAYTLPRNTNAGQLVSVLLQGFSAILTPDLQDAFTRQGLDIYAAVTLASMVEREAVVDEEKPMIASVFLNRLAIGMKLDSDPTVQYAIGYNPAQGTWWTNPLSLADLQVDSPFNTYRYNGLPPAPIGSPDLASLQAVGYPAQTPYYYFRARCDGSGLHAFAETFDEHKLNACP
ncbi:MAG: endolytic transglycosylase MltG [Chloroflexi bacterium]|nr:endolytic transglycosylase MltG [Chloroflexota bacterium]